jgi:hypothetical protein
MPRPKHKKSTLIYWSGQYQITVIRNRRTVCFYLNGTEENFKNIPRAKYADKLVIWDRILTNPEIDTYIELSKPEK